MPASYRGLFSGFDLEDVPALTRLSIGLNYYKTSGLFSNPWAISGSLKRRDVELPRNSLERSNIGDIWLAMNTKPLISEIISTFMNISLDDHEALLAGGACLRKCIDPLLDNWPPTGRNLTAKQEAYFDELYDEWRQKHVAPSHLQTKDPRKVREENIANEEFLQKALAEHQALAEKKRKDLADAVAARNGTQNYISPYAEQPTPEPNDRHALYTTPAERRRNPAPVVLPVITVFKRQIVQKSHGKAEKKPAQTTPKGKRNKQPASSPLSSPGSGGSGIKIKFDLKNLKISASGSIGSAEPKRASPAAITEHWVVGDKKGAQRHTPLKKKGETIVDDGNVDFTRPIVGVVDVSKLHIRLITTAKCPSTGKTIPGVGLDRLYGRDVDWNDKESVYALDKWRGLCHSRDFGTGWKQRPARWLQIEKEWVLNFLLANSNTDWATLTFAYNNQHGNILQKAGWLYVQIPGYDNDVMAQARKGPLRKAENIQAVAAYWPEYQVMVRTSSIGKGLLPSDKPVAKQPLFWDTVYKNEPVRKKTPPSRRVVAVETDSEEATTEVESSGSSSQVPIPVKVAQSLKPKSNFEAPKMRMYHTNAASMKTTKYESSSSEEDDSEEDEDVDEPMEEPEDWHDGSYRGRPPQKRARRV